MDIRPTKIQVILGSTRQNRFSEKPGLYIIDELKKKESVEVELVDLRDWPLPFFDAPSSPAALKGNYPYEIVKKWGTVIDGADGYIMVTPEYNHGYPAVLKNAIDWLFTEWKDKPVGFVSYGNVGGARAIEQLRQVVIELQMLPIRNAIHIPSEVYLSMMKEKAPVNPELFKPLREGMRGDRLAAFFNELINLAVVLKIMRQRMKG